MNLQRQVFSLKNKVSKHVSFEDEDIDEIDEFVIHSFVEEPKTEGELLSTTHKVRRSTPARNRKVVDRFSPY